MIRDELASHIRVSAWGSTWKSMPRMHVTRVALWSSFSRAFVPTK